MSSRFSNRFFRSSDGDGQDCNLSVLLRAGRRDDSVDIVPWWKRDSSFAASTSSKRCATTLTKYVSRMNVPEQADLETHQTKVIEL